MHKHLSFLREASKFLAGLIAADLIFGIWALIHRIYPFQFIGMQWTLSAIYSWIVLDGLLLLFLIHYAWHAHIPGRRPRRAFLLMAGWVFAVVCVAHFLRVFTGVSLMIGGVLIPYWVNAAATIVTAFLSWTSFAFARTTTK